jgi:hypothetical protein
MLGQKMCLPTSPSSLHLKFGYFNIQIFFIKGCSELHVVDFDEFVFLTYQHGFEVLSRPFQKLADRHNLMFCRLAQMYRTCSLTSIYMAYRETRFSSIVFTT